jgi:zinc transport system permease protein
MNGDELGQLLALASVQRALGALVLCGLGLPIIGVFIVGLDIFTARFALMHSALLGAALAVFLGVDPLAGALLASLLTGVVLVPLSQHPTGASGAMGFLMTVTIALAFLLLAAAGESAATALGLLWGSVLATRPLDLALLAIINLGVIALYLSLRRQLALLFFDREMALVSGVPVNRVLLLVLVAVALGVGAVMPVTGALLVDAVTLLPALAARNLGRSLGAIVWLAVAFGLTGNLVGFALALVLDQPVGPILVLTAGAITLVTFLMRQRLENIP